VWLVVTYGAMMTDGTEWMGRPIGAEIWREVLGACAERRAGRVLSSYLVTKLAKSNGEDEELPAKRATRDESRQVCG
jgi:hypothetical protein